jgi:hypothetical protein
MSLNARASALLSTIPPLCRQDRQPKHHALTRRAGAAFCDLHLSSLPSARGFWLSWLCRKVACELGHSDRMFPPDRGAWSCRCFEVPEPLLWYDYFGASPCLICTIQSNPKGGIFRRRDFCCSWVSVVLGTPLISILDSLLSAVYFVHLMGSSSEAETAWETQDVKNAPGTGAGKHRAAPRKREASRCFKHVLCRYHGLFFPPLQFSLQVSGGTVLRRSVHQMQSALSRGQTSSIGVACSSRNWPMSVSPL